ncbi:MAG TPA: SMC-Scp complex subunit ScpB [Spirochaetota bacterium]|nr:SMC-Scp complex subunit ScpB [Spirochaetota bacterium]HOM39152.1 SMC-Scp complex subunit ScpB [Spirochaetota bacterium]HPQ48329.1 SMC-Scp complex subunit ScpB [Spirochaetota bacterium]
MERKKKLLEALLFLENNPLKIEDVKKSLDIGDLEIMTIVNILNENYINSNSSLRVTIDNDKIYIFPDDETMEALKNIYSSKRRRLSKAGLEVLSIVAWKQPVTKSEIDFIRGVESGNIIRNLIAEGFITVVGKKDVIGKPQTYGTTEKFLTYFGLKSLDELPRIENLKDYFDEGLIQEEF